VTTGVLLLHGSSGKPDLSYVGYYQQSLRMFPEQAEAAQIPAERFGGDLLLMAGGDDHLWPSVKFAKQIALRRGTLITQVLISGPGHKWCGS